MSLSSFFMFFSVSLYSEHALLQKINHRLLSIQASSILEKLTWSCSYIIKGKKRKANAPHSNTIQ
jgi:hypothetical protein